MSDKEDSEAFEPTPKPNFEEEKLANIRKSTHIASNKSKSPPKKSLASKKTSSSRKRPATAEDDLQGESSTKKGKMTDPLKEISDKLRELKEGRLKKADVTAIVNTALDKKVTGRLDSLEKNDLTHQQRKQDDRTSAMEKRIAKLESGLKAG